MEQFCDVESHLVKAHRHGAETFVDVDELFPTEAAALYRAEQLVREKRTTDVMVYNTRTQAEQILKGVDWPFRQFLDHVKASKNERPEAVFEELLPPHSTVIESRWWPGTMDVDEDGNPDWVHGAVPVYFYPVPGAPRQAA